MTTEAPHGGNQPVIGITPCLDEPNGRPYYNLRKINVAAITDQGGLPLLLPFIEDREALKQTLSLVDGLYFTGGCDIDPGYFGEDPVPALGALDPYRDAFEAALYRLGAEMDIPILGVCRGMQIINAAAGGSLYQDIHSQRSGTGGHSPKDTARWLPYHHVTVEADSILTKIFGKQRLKVNSFHHQAVKTAAPGYRVTASAGDGVIEAIENRALSYCLCVQWHPEDMYIPLPEFAGIYRSFVEAAALYRAKKQKKGILER